MAVISTLLTSILAGLVIHANLEDRPLAACELQNCSAVFLWQVASGSPPWRFGRITSPDQKESFVSITKTATTMESDPDFAGLMVRCGKGGRIDVVVVLIRPLAPKAHPQVSIRSGAAAATAFEGTMAPGGAAVLLPDSAGVLPGGAWRGLNSLLIAVRNGNDEIKGKVDLEGLPAAYVNLLGNCE